MVTTGSKIAYQNDPHVGANIVASRIRKGRSKLYSCDEACDGEGRIYNISCIADVYHEFIKELMILYVQILLHKNQIF